MTEHATSCANCGLAMASSSQKFCPDCGQATPAHRIDWHFLAHEVQHSIFHVDKGILHTAKQLIIRPGKFIREYIEGKRVNHFKPILMIMITGAVAAFLAHKLLGVSLMGANVNIRAGQEPNAQALDAASSMMAVFKWLEDHFALSAVLLVPVMALWLKVAFRRMRQINYPEWLVIACYLTVQYFLIYLVWLPISKFLGLDQNVVAFLMVAANALTLAQFFAPEYAWYKSILRTAVAFVMYFAFVIVAAVAAGVWIGYRAGLIHG